jgi:hypothetical protein
VKDLNPALPGSQFSREGMVMKKLRYLVLAALAAPALAGSSADQQYETLQQAYYHFDPKAYQSFTCHVDVDTLDTLVAKIKRVAASQPGTLQVSDQLASYSVTVDHNNGVSINDPTFDLVVVNDKGVADPATLKLGIEQTKLGFDTHVHGVDEVIIGILKSYIQTHRNVVSVTHDGDKWVVKLATSGVSDIQIINGSHTHDNISSGDTSIVTDSSYIPLGGNKLGLQATEVQMSQGEHSVNSNMTLAYQELGTLQVPASIITKTTVATAGTAQTPVVAKINFQGCSINV